MTKGLGLGTALLAMTKGLNYLGMGTALLAVARELDSLGLGSAARLGLNGGTGALRVLD